MPILLKYRLNAILKEDKMAINRDLRMLKKESDRLNVLGNKANKI